MLPEIAPHRIPTTSRAAPRKDEQATVWFAHQDIEGVINIGRGIDAGIDRLYAYKRRAAAAIEPW
jgi:hypothetical protein